MHLLILTEEQRLIKINIPSVGTSESFTTSPHIQHRAMKQRILLNNNNTFIHTHFKVLLQMNSSVAHMVDFMKRVKSGVYLKLCKKYGVKIPKTFIRQI